MQYQERETKLDKDGKDKKICKVNETYTTNVQCISQSAQLIVISKEEFLKFKTNQTLWPQICKFAADLVQRRTEKIIQQEKVKEQINVQFN